MEKNENLGER